MEPVVTTPVISVITPVIRSVISRVNAGSQRSYGLARVHSPEAKQMAHDDFARLWAASRQAKIPEEVQELATALSSSIGILYMTSTREVWFQAKRLAEGHERNTFLFLDAARRATGMTPTWLHPIRKIADNTDKRRMTQLIYAGRTRSFFQEVKQLFVIADAFDALGLLVAITLFPISVPAAVIGYWRESR